MIDFRLIGSRLRQARMKSNLNQEDAANISGISTRTIRRSESSGTNSVRTLLTLCETYSIPITDIIGSQDDTNYLISTIKQLGPNACDVLRALCETMNNSDIN